MSSTQRLRHMHFECASSLLPSTRVLEWRRERNVGSHVYCMVVIVRERTHEENACTRHA